MAVKPNLLKAAGNRYSSALQGTLSDSATSMVVNDGTGLNTSGGILVIDPDVPAKREFIYYESRSGGNITISSDGRGIGGSTAVSHDAGAVVKDVILDSHVNNIIARFLIEHNDNGTHNLPGSQTASGTAISSTNQIVDEAYFQSEPGQLLNGKIQVTVASNNITLAVKTLAGNDPSTTDRVNVRIGNSLRTITAALSVTLNAGTNWFAAGQPELATLEHDYFAYVGWRSASSEVVLGFARIPYAGIYSDFSGSSAVQRYGAFSTAPASSDEVEICGRFGAILSAGSSYNWSVPTFTNKNLIQKPIRQTRRLAMTLTPSGFSANPTNQFAAYEVNFDMCYYEMRTTPPGTSNSTSFTVPLPFDAKTQANNAWFGPVIDAQDNSVSLTGGGRSQVLTGSNTLTLLKDFGGTAWTNSGGKQGSTALWYPII